MRKLLTIICVALLCVTTGYAQKAKFGHVDYGAVLKEMPGIDTAQQALLTYQQELEAVGKLQDFVSSSEQELQTKQLELLKPFQERLLAAIKTVAEREKYTYVFDITMCAFHNEADDLTAAVRTELGIK